MPGLLSPIVADFKIERGAIMDRNHAKKHCITTMFIDIIRNAKKGYERNAKIYSENLFGMILYMRSVDDITE